MAPVRPGRTLPIRLGWVVFHTFETSDFQYHRTFFFTRILLDCNWGFSLEAAFFAPFLSDLLSAMDRIPLSVGDDRSGPSSSKQPSFDLNAPAAEQAVYEQMLEAIKNQKQTFAGLIDPLIKKEAQKYPDIRKLPSSRDVVEELIRRIGSNKARAENDHNAPINNFRNLKTWLTRACQNAEDETKGRMSIRSEIRALILEYSQNDNENSLSFCKRRTADE